MLRIIALNWYYHQTIGEAMKIAYLVIGPESSGTRMMTKILLKAGCSGSGEYSQPWDSGAFKGPKVVWRRSAPHGGKWVSSKQMINRCIAEGYTPKLIIMNRDWIAVSSSQVAHNHSGNLTQALGKIRRAYKEIYQDLLSTRDEFIVVSYESLVSRPKQVLQYISTFTKLDIDTNYKVKDGNEKWFKQEQQ
jgi:LPS sulfotransferase NodH